MSMTIHPTVLYHMGISSHQPPADLLLLIEAEQPFHRTFSWINPYRQPFFLIKCCHRVLSGSFSCLITSAWGPGAVYQARCQPDLWQAECVQYSRTTHRCKVHGGSLWSATGTTP